MKYLVMCATCVAATLFLSPALANPAAGDKAKAAKADNPLPGMGCSVADLKGGYTWHETTRTDYSKMGYEKFGAGWVHAVSVGREVHDGKGNITAGHMTINNTFDGKIKRTGYTGKVTMNANCVGTYRITQTDGTDGGGGTIYMDPVSKKFTLLDEFNIGVGVFIKDGGPSATAK